MAIFAHRIHLPNRVLHQVEKDNQSRDWFWLKGYENEVSVSAPKSKNHKKKTKKEGTTTC